MGKLNRCGAPHLGRKFTTMLRPQRRLRGYINSGFPLPTVSGNQGNYLYVPPVLTMPAAQPGTFAAAVGQGGSCGCGPRRQRHGGLGDPTILGFDLGASTSIGGMAIPNAAIAAGVGLVGLMVFSKMFKGGGRNSGRRPSRRLTETTFGS
jgi:hypothetical protein